MLLWSSALFIYRFLHCFCLQFIRKLDSTEFSNEEKLQVMQSISEELSVSFDAKKLELKLWATPETELVSVHNFTIRPMI